MSPSRREFVERSAALALGLGLPDLPWTPESTVPVQQRAPNETPDLVVVNARVYTVDDALPRAEAFAVKDGRFLAVGSNADIRNLVKPGTQLIDAAGMAVTPGFIDAHCHPSGVNELIGVNV
ncbi:MAG: amidohydrolase, partial [Gemmatimonadetes bacterium]|nr:amidohydrolase [Gemmatimonadota bacterium]